MSESRDPEAERERRRAINREVMDFFVAAMSGVHSGDADEAREIAKALIATIAKGEIKHVRIVY